MQATVMNIFRIGNVTYNPDISCILFSCFSNIWCTTSSCHNATISSRHALRMVVASSESFVPADLGRIFGFDMTFERYPIQPLPPRTEISLDAGFGDAGKSVRLRASSTEIKGNNCIRIRRWLSVRSVGVGGKSLTVGREMELCFLGEVESHSSCSTCNICLTDLPIKDIRGEMDDEEEKGELDQI